MMNSYVAVDLETTELDPKTDKIMETKAVRMVNDRMAEEFHTIVHPRHQPEKEVVGLTDIGDEVLRDAPGIEKIVGQVVALYEGFPLVGHRIMLDYSFSERAAVNAGLEFEKEGVDTLGFCRKSIPEEERKNLGVARRYFRVGTGTAHRALSDAQVASGLYQELMGHHEKNRPEASGPKTLIYKVKKEQPATKGQKEDLHELLKYHRIDIAIQIDHLGRNEVSRVTDKIIPKYGRIVRR